MGDPERARPSAASARSAATSARRRARARSSGSSRATIPRSTAAGSATRAASPTRTCTPATGSPSRSRACAARARADLAGTTRSTAPRRCCAARRAAIVTALSGSETVEQAYALAQAAARRARRALGRAAGVDLRRARRVPAAALGDRATAEIVVVVGDDEVADRAPVVDLWLEAAAERRRGRRIRSDRATVAARRPAARYELASRERARRRARAPSARS